MPDKLTGSECVYGFAAWLTSSKGGLIFGASHNTALAAELVDKFCKVNNLDDPRDDWHQNLHHPKTTPEVNND